MVEKVNLEIRIESAIKEARANYNATMAAVEKLKEEINRLERRITKEGMDKNAEDVDTLSALIDRFNELIDAQIVENKRAWRKYEELKRESGTQAIAIPWLNEFYDACTKAEQLAADLTCFSLGNPKR